MDKHGHTFVENLMTLPCAKIQGKISMFGKVGAPENSFWD